MSAGTQYEYKVVALDIPSLVAHKARTAEQLLAEFAQDNVIEQLNALGAEGWRFVSGESYGVIILMRELPPPPVRHW